MNANVNKTATYDNPFVGSGWRFPILPDETGALAYNSGDDNVEQSLRLVLLTAVGERIMRPDFGSKAPALVYSPASVQYLGLLETTIRDAVRDYEPRVQLDSVLVEADPNTPSRVNVSVDYHVRQSNTRNNLVFPFYLANPQSVRT
jgi:phage baseplate assembly protein W